MIDQSMTITENEFYKDKKLAPMTSINLGGTAKFYFKADTEEEILKVLQYAKENDLRIQVLGGGSNTIFGGKNFDGIILHLGMDHQKIEKKNDNVFVTVGAGKNWNTFVTGMTEYGFPGVEALAGIPGNVGATPIQNVGAYGQEVADTIHEVHTIERSTLKKVTFKNKDCKFSYRTSRFKTTDKDKYIITEVIFKLKQTGRPVIAYPQLEKRIKEEVNLEALPDGRRVLEAVRDMVIKIRKEKSMVLDSQDPNSVSCGSFFMNPIISKSKFVDVQNQARQSGIEEEIPNFDEKGKVKLSAAWLLERSGFHKGFKKNQPIGLSENHNLAIVNRGGTTKGVLDLQKKIQEKVKKVFGIKLEREPVLVE